MANVALWHPLKCKQQLRDAEGVAGVADNIWSNLIKHVLHSEKVDGGVTVCPCSFSHRKLDLWFKLTAPPSVCREVLASKGRVRMSSLSMWVFKNKEGLEFASQEQRELLAANIFLRVTILIPMKFSKPLQTSMPNKANPWLTGVHSLGGPVY